MTLDDAVLAQISQSAIILGTFIMSIIGSWIVLELRKLHIRIDRYVDRFDSEMVRLHARLDNHISESVEKVHKPIAQFEMHIKNGHKHPD